MTRRWTEAGAAGRNDGIVRDGHRPMGSGAPVMDRNAAGGMPYFDTPQKWGQISVVASMPVSFGEAML